MDDEFKSTRYRRFKVQRANADETEIRYVLLLTAYYGLFESTSFERVGI